MQTLTVAYHSNDDDLRRAVFLVYANDANNIVLASVAVNETNTIVYYYNRDYILNSLNLSFLHFSAKVIASLADACARHNQLFTLVQPFNITV